MANDRLYLRCKNCKAMLLLVKYYPGGGLLETYGWQEDISVVNEFLVTHVGCSPHAGEFSLSDDSCFEVINEAHDAHGSGLPMR